MTETQYGIRKAEAREILPEIDLLPKILHAGEKLDVAIFGPDTYEHNISNMQKKYFHSRELSSIYFKPATSAESISIAAHNFKNFAKPQIFNPNWLHATRILKTSEGFFANLPKDEKGNLIIDEKILKNYLNESKKVNGIYLYENNSIIKDFGFAPYETFKQGVQDAGDFVESGLARVLEHTEKTAEKLKEIASKENYSGGVEVWGFDSVNEPVLRVAGLDSGLIRTYGRLGVVGDYCYGYYGFAFGVLDKSAEGASQKNK